MTHAPERFDFDLIARWIGNSERVLDLGCGDGSLLRHLTEVRQIRGYGVEIDIEKVTACIANGVNVVQSDLERGLAGFEDGFFDHVVMSLSLQTVHRTEQILTEMLRVGREAIVSFPNFGYWRNRQALLNGRMPVSKDLPYEWFNTPNVRFFTIADFEALCADRGLVVVDSVAVDEAGKIEAEDANFLASLAFYKLARAT
jgi:methionine biosynthesis protein MetW